MLYAGSNLDKARKIFTKAIKHRPRIRLTIRQQTRVLKQWRKAEAIIVHEPGTAVSPVVPDAGRHLGSDNRTCGL